MEEQSKKQGRSKEGIEGVKEQGIICNKYSALPHWFGGNMKRFSVGVSLCNMTLGAEDPQGSLTRMSSIRDQGGKTWWEKSNLTNQTKRCFKFQVFSNITPINRFLGAPNCFSRGYSGLYRYLLCFCKVVHFPIMDRRNCWERGAEPEPGVWADVAYSRLMCMQLRLYSTVDSKLPCQPNGDWQH